MRGVRRWCVWPIQLPAKTIVDQIWFHLANLGSKLYECLEHCWAESMGARLVKVTRCESLSFIDFCLAACSLRQLIRWFGGDLGDRGDWNGPYPYTYALGRAHSDASCRAASQKKDKNHQEYGTDRGISTRRWCKSLSKKFTIKTSLKSRAHLHQPVSVACRVSWGVRTYCCGWEDTWAGYWWRQQSGRYTRVAVLGWWWYCSGIDRSSDRGDGS